ncbi:MAG: glycosyltransferase family 39 protein [Anaerolineales bacterium]|nr:glycosyltransferase family 39 protein [Anaerolineales bacterium]
MKNVFQELSVPRILFILVMFLTIGLQITYRPNTELDIDTVQIPVIIQQAADENTIPVHGMLNSQGVYNPPFFIWLYLLPFYLLHDLGWILLLPSLLIHLAAIICSYYLAKEIHSEWMGLIAVTIYSFTRLGTYVSRGSWAQALLPGLFLIMLFCFYQWIFKGKKWYSALLIIFTAIVPGIHWGGIVLSGSFIILSVFFFIHKNLSLSKTIKPGPFILGIIVSVFFWTPFLNFEFQRDFTDLKALYSKQVVFQEASDLTPLCLPEEETEESGLRNSISNYLLSISPSLHKISEIGYWFLVGIVHGFDTNFHWISNTSIPVLNAYRTIILWLQLIPFLVGVIWIISKMIRHETSSIQILLMLSFLVPLLLQNLTPHHVSFRPTIAWMFYGPQTLIIAYFITAFFPFSKKVILTISIVVIVIFGFEVTQQVNSNLLSELNPQLKAVNWIGQDAREKGNNLIHIRYDLLRNTPESCWVVSYGKIINYDDYYIGIPFDFLLKYYYGVENVSPAHDGWIEDPDYILIQKKKNVAYYQEDLYQINDLGTYIIITPK